MSLRPIGVEPIAIKGWAVSRFYPKGMIRSYSDIDLAIPPDQFQIVKEGGALTKGLAVSVDLHEGFRDRDALSWQELFAHSYTVPLNGVPIRLLSDEDNLRLTAAHWLIDGGVYESRLWDIYYLVENRKQNFDWERCLDAAGPVRRSWVHAAIATARDYLNLDVSKLPDSVKEYKLPYWYTNTLEKEWARGSYLRVPIWLCLNRPKVLIEQARRRFPPNPIAATTDTEGPIDDSPRFTYQVKSFWKKLRPAASSLHRRLTTKH